MEVFPRRKEIVPNGTTNFSMDGIHLLPVQVMEDEDMSAGAQRPGQFCQGSGFVAKVGEDIVANDQVKGAGCKGQTMGVGLGEVRFGAALPGVLQHSVGQVDGYHPGRRGTLPQEGAERPGASAHFQN